MIDWSLRHKLTALIVALVFAIAVGFEIYLPHRMAERGERAMARRAQALVTILASTVTPALDFDDATAAQRSLGSLAENDEALWAVVWRGDDSRFAQWHGELAPPSIARSLSCGVVFRDDSAIAVAPLRTLTGTTGTLAVAFSLRELEADRRADQLSVLGLCTLALAFGCAGAYGIGSVLIRPIQQISVAARRVADGDMTLEHLDQILSLGRATSQDEAQQLTAAVVDMAHKLADHVRRLGQARSDAEAAEERAISASAAKSNFLANMSHELRTPLNAIIGYAEILTEDYEDPNLRADLKKIHSAGTHLFGLISGILDIAKIEAGRMELFVEEWHLPDLVREVIPIVAPMSDKSGSTLTFDIAPEVGLVQTDQTKVRQILFNLLSNAAKFTKSGAIHLDVDRRLDAQGCAMISLVVTDTGIGMSDEQLDRVFLPFTQADTSTTKRFGGTGLGLTLAKQFCEMLGGRISVTSKLGTGSTFTIELPERLIDHPSAET